MYQGFCCVFRWSLFSIVARRGHIPIFLELYAGILGGINGKGDIGICGTGAGTQAWGLGGVPYWVGFGEGGKGVEWLLAVEHGDMRERKLKIRGWMMSR